MPEKNRKEKTMKKKTVTLFALMLTLIFSLSVAVMTACSDISDDNDNPAGDGSYVSLVDDDALTGKLFAMYTFEDSGNTLSAVNPYTGAALSSNNGEYLGGGRTATPQQQGESTTVFNTDSAIRLGSFSDVITDEFEDSWFVDGNDYEGLSISFWAYNNETIVGPTTEDGESADWSNLATNGYESINWGNFTHMTASEGTYDAVYPSASNNLYVGRGAYTEASYEAARAIWDNESLSHYMSSYACWNAVAGNRQDATATTPDNSYVVALAEAYYQTWRYITVNIDLEGGLSFYVNGRLAFNYTPAIFNSGAIGAAGGWEQIYADFLLSALGTGDMYIDMFGAITGIYVDDLIVGKSLTAEEACALYEDLSGTTWNEDDLTLESSASTEEQEQSAAITEYLAEMLEGVTTPVEGDNWGNGTSAADAGVIREDTNDDGVITDAVYDAREAWFAEDHDLEAEFIEVIGSTSLDNSYAPSSSNYYYVPDVNEDGTFTMTVSGLLMTSGAQNYHTAVMSLYSGDVEQTTPRIDNFVNYAAEGLTVASNNMNISWVDTSTNGVYLNVIQRFAKLDVILAFDGTNLTLTYNIYYYYAGEEVTLETASGAEFQYTAPKDSTTLFNYITYNVTAASGLDVVLDLNALSLKLGSECAAFLVEEVTGGSTSETAPQVSENPAADAALQAQAQLTAKREEALANAVSTALDGGEAVATVGAEDLSNTYGIDSRAITPSGDTWTVTISGYMHSSALNNYSTPGLAIYIGGADNLVGVLRGDRYINAGSGSNAYAGGDARVAWATTVNGDAVAADAVDWADWTNVYAYSKYDITISFDGSALTVSFTVEAVDGGVAYREAVSYTDNGETKEYVAELTPSDNVWVTSATITDAATLALASDMYFAISSESCYYTVTALSGAAIG